MNIPPGREPLLDSKRLYLNWPFYLARSILYFAFFIAAGLLFRQGTPPHASYLFKHALVQDAAYSTLLREPTRAALRPARAGRGALKLHRARVERIER